MGQADLEQLCQKDAGEILVRLTDPMSGFKLLIDSPHEQRLVMINLITTAVQKVVTYRGIPESLLALLNDFKFNATEDTPEYVLRGNDARCIWEQTAFVRRDSS